jgi:hypothetical protein
MSAEPANQIAAANTLGEYGRDAKAALPALVDYAKRSGGATERENAIQAIEKIDPQAAEQFKTE